MARSGADPGPSYALSDSITNYTLMLVVAFYGTAPAASNLIPVAYINTNGGNIGTYVDGSYYNMLTFIDATHVQSTAKPYTAAIYGIK